MFRRTAAALLVSSLLAVSAPASATSWPMFQNDRRHTGRTTAIGPSTSSVRKLWEYKAVSWIKNEPSIGPDGTIYIGDSKFPLCALTPSGARIWCTDVGGFVNQSSPAVGNPFSKTDAGGTRTVQTIYIGDRNNVFWAIDSEGDVLWHYRIHLDGDVRQSPLIGPGPAHTVYMMCGCTTKGVLHAFRPDGTLLWSVDLPQVRDASPAGIQVGSHFRLYVVTNNGQLYAIDDLGTSGQIAWHLPLGAPSAHSSPAIGAGRIIYVGNAAGLFAVKDDGTSGHVLPGWPFGTAGGVDTTPTIGLGTGKVFASSFDGGTRTLYAIDPRTNPPTKLWSFTGPGTSTTNLALTPSAVVGGNGFLYAAIGPQIYGFDPAAANPASPKWRFTLPADAISLSLGDGVLYVSAKNAKLYALTAGP
ncbi:MAG TPA: PQQ-binding-like beta-propeller repeat protein [Candidatus Binatia bacterium]|nr:PQQ-binding-like beta-propeller repeat protein [Candidatus Binatia bacterium]